MPVQVLILTIALFAVVLGLIYLVLFLLNRFVHRYAAIATSAALIAYMTYGTISGFNECGADPTYVAPGPSEAGEGQMVFNCDGPGGASIYLGLLLMVPMIALLAWLTHRIVRKPASAPSAIEVNG